MRRLSAMVGWLVMKGVRLLAAGLLGVGTLLGALSACGSNDRRASLVSAGGQSSAAGHSGQGADAGRTSEIPEGGGDSDGGAAGDVGMPATAHAIFPERFHVDVGCGLTPSAVPLLIQNGGAQPLTISKLSADSEYGVDVDMPLTIAPGDSGKVLVTAPAPTANAVVGETTAAGTLTFTTNEPGTATHHIELISTLFGGGLEFLDKSGNPLPDASLVLHYSSPTECPDSVTYRVHNTGNLAFKLMGPAFPVHFGGTSTGASGMSLTPDGVAEFRIGGVTTAGEVCSGAGQLTFTVGSGFCGAVPALNVIWPAGSLTSCVCTAPTQ
jgi:hypothetical protein